MKKRIIGYLMAAALLWTTAFSSYADETAILVVPLPISGEINAGTISKSGNVTLSITCEAFLAAGYKFGDIVTLSFLDKTLDVPFGDNYSDVDAGEVILVAREKDDNIKAAINTGDFATSYGIAVKTSYADESYTWDFADGIEGPVSCTISMKEPGGYYGGYITHQLSYTDERSDYPNLSDEQFANFRGVQTTGMGRNRLYRSSSPVDPEHNRNAYADAALKNCGATVIMDLKDDEATLTAFPGYAESYYAFASHIAVNAGMDFTLADNQEKLARGLRFFAENPGVCVIHCQEGKDRTGIACALLECLMGASLDEVVSDYMLTYYNYYGIEPDSAKYEVVSQGNILKNLQKLFGTEDLESVDLALCAESYIHDIGLSDDEIRSLKENLSADV